jgi:fatty-acyl-CoA synthase
VDADGYIWVYGREKDLIIRAGGNIDPKLIEEILAHHPAVLLSAAIGRPDAMKGELPIVYVQLKDGAQATPDEILTFCRNHMTERAAIPVEAIIVPIMPMTAVAKIAKPVLRLDAMQRVVTEVAKSVIGSNRRTNVTIDESGKRPAAIIQVEVEPADREGALKRLRDAYAGFAFKTDIQLMEV